MNTSLEQSAPETAQSPYGTKRTRWIKPVALALALVAFDDLGAIAFFVGIFLILAYLPRSLIARKYRGCRRERLTRFALYLSAVAAVFGLHVANAGIAQERADRIVAAAESYRAANGKYPDRLEELVPRFIPELPAKAKLTLLDGGFQYHATAGSHTLMYMVGPPVRRYYMFETRTWRNLD